MARKSRNRLSGRAAAPSDARPGPARTDPIVIGAVGGSGTRVFSRIARDAGLFMGNHVDAQQDSRPMSRIYAEFTSEYVEAGGRLAAERSGELARRVEESLQAHLDGLPGPGHPWGMKNPRSMLMLPFWHQRFPEMRFLHVIRDGRDMAYSPAQGQIRKHGMALLGLDPDLPEAELAMTWWSYANTEAADFGESELGERYMRVRLEDLCAHPKRTVTSLFAFFGAEGRMTAAIREVEPPPTLGRWRQRPERVLW